MDSLFVGENIMLPMILGKEKLELILADVNWTPCELIFTVQFNRHRPIIQNPAFFLVRISDKDA